MYIILLKKLSFDQISSGRNSTRWQYGVPKWYEIVKRLGTPVLKGHLSQYDFIMPQIRYF